MDDSAMTVYSMLCADLGRSPSTIPSELRDYMEMKIEAARQRLIEAGITPDASNAAQLDLWTMYAGYLYRRRDSDGEMPRSLRLALNDAKAGLPMEGGS